MNGEEIEKKSHKSLILAIPVLTLFTAALAFGYLEPYKLNIASEWNLANTISRSNTPVKILFVGDVMLDRNVRNIIDRKGVNTFFAGVKDLVKSADIAVANLEGTFTTNSSITASLKNKTLQFTFDPALAPGLADIGFDILGLANNHSLNFGKEGLEMTRRYIGSAGMFYYGDPDNKDEISTVITRNGIKFGLIGFHEFSYINFKNIYSEIARLRPLVDVLIISPHWGIEYDTKPTNKMIKWGHQFIDDGADAVIGTHSHIIGEIEEYKGKRIYYSLGNFAFDQYFSKETMEGLAVGIEVNKSDKGIDLKYTHTLIKIDRNGVNIDNSN